MSSENSIKRRKRLNVPGWCTTERVSHLTGLTSHQLYRMRKLGKIEFQNYCGTIIYSEDSVLEFRDRCRVPAQR